MVDKIRQAIRQHDSADHEAIGGAGVKPGLHGSGNVRSKK
jgi:hypothetical protein